MIDKIAQWLTRIILLPLGILLGWYAVSRFLGMRIEESQSPITSGSNAVELILAGFLLYAAVYPGPPWRNKPLIHFFWLISIILLLTGWWVGTVIGAGFMTKFLFGNHVPFYGFVLIVVMVIINVVGFFIWGGVKNFVKRFIRRTSPAIDRKP